MDNLQLVLQSLRDVGIWFIEVLVIPLGLPIVLSGGIIYTPTLGNPGSKVPELGAWFAAFTSAEILFLGIVAASAVLFDFFRTTALLQIPRGKSLVNFFAGLCTICLLTAGSAYGHHISLRMLNQLDSAEPNPPAVNPVLLTGLLIFVSAVTHFLLRYFERIAQLR